MKLRPFQWIWRQLNGPQVTAITELLSRYVEHMFNTVLDYLTKISIKTANSTHLTLLGACMGVSRPIISIASVYEFLFTHDPEHGKTYGVSAAPGPLQVGGIFSDLSQDVVQRKRVLCPTEYYRAILDACIQSDAEPFSIVYLDKALASIWNKYHPDREPTYTFTWFDRQYPDQSIDREDVRLDLGNLEDWGTQETAIIWQGVLEGIINSVWNPTRRIQVIFS